MKILVNIARAIVGVLFIFSGLVKANDPIGLSYKMQEFFLAWGTTWLDGISLALSIIMIALEIIAGVALLLGWKPKAIAWFLLLLIVFFTFLTGYAYLSGKFKNCGCFGDCIPITARQSFLKDVVLLLLILILFFKKQYIKPVFSKGITTIVLLLFALFSFAAQWFTLKYLPVADCLPFKKGNNIMQQMQMPANAIPDSIVINFVYEKAGQTLEFTAANFPDDFNDKDYKFIKRYDKLIRPGVNNEPPIKAFGLGTADGNDITQNILQANKVVLLFVENTSTPVSVWQSAFERIISDAQKKEIPVYIVTSSMLAVKKEIAATSFKNIEVLNCDNTTIRTAARTNPTIYLLNKGTIMEKKSYKNFSEILL